MSIELNDPKGSSRYVISSDFFSFRFPNGAEEGAFVIPHLVTIFKEIPQEALSQVVSRRF